MPRDARATPSSAAPAPASAAPPRPADRTTTVATAATPPALYHPEQGLTPPSMPSLCRTHFVKPKLIMSQNPAETFDATRPADRPLGSMKSIGSLATYA